MTKIIGQACSSQDMERMHALYRKGGEEKRKAPHIVYSDPFCPHGCGQQLRTIDFCLEAHGPAVHDPLVLAWWQDVGFATMLRLDSLHHTRQTSGHGGRGRRIAAYAG